MKPFTHPYAVSFMERMQKNPKIAWEFYEKQGGCICKGNILRGKWDTITKQR